MAVGWLEVDEVEKLLEVDAPGNVADPGQLCLASVDAAGAWTPGATVKDNGSVRNLSLTLRGPLDPAVAQALAADAGWQEATASRRVPGFDKPADGKPYLLLRLGADGAQAYPTRVGEDGRLTGDVVVTLVDADGMGVYRPVHLQ